MKNILKLSFLTAGIALSSSLSAQEQIKTEAQTTATQLETPKSDASATKQDPAKKTTESSATKTDAKNEKTADTSETGGGTRMAISEQGTPKKNKNKGKTKTSSPPTEAPKK